MVDIRERDENTIREILEAARTLFSKYGLKKTTMDDVARAVGKGKSTLYYYYPGKTELFEAVVLDELKNTLKDIRRAINQEPTSTGKLKAFLFSRLQVRAKVHNLSQVVYDDIFDHFKEICELKREFEKTQLDIIREIITGGIQAQEFREMPGEEVAFFCNWITAAFSGLELPLSTNPSLLSDHMATDRIVDFILLGIGRNLS